jgi:hypothetical protein
MVSRKRKRDPLTSRGLDKSHLFSCVEKTTPHESFVSKLKSRGKLHDDSTAKKIIRVHKGVL